MQKQVETFINYIWSGCHISHDSPLQSVITPSKHLTELIVINNGIMQYLIWVKKKKENKKVNWIKKKQQ